MRNLKYTVLVAILFTHLLRLSGQTNFMVCISDSILHSEIIRKNKTILDSFEFNYNYNNCLATNTAFFDRENPNYIRDLDLLSDFVPANKLRLYNSLYEYDKDIMVDIEGMEYKPLDPSILLEFMLIVKDKILLDCDTNIISYSIAPLNMIASQKEIDIYQDYSEMAYVTIPNESKYSYVLEAYRKLSFHKNVQKRDYLAFMGPDRKTVIDWIYVRGEKEFEYKDNKYMINSLKVCDTRLLIVDKIIFLSKLCIENKLKILVF